jgi:serine/threonine-protein kinase
VSDIPERLRAGLAERYRFLEEVGRGGMATVYLALDLKHGRQVAIKVLRETLLDAGPEAQRFLREIQIAARLNHPQILPLHDSGSIDGLLYYVMPFMGCESLRERLRREGRLPVDQAVRIARLVAGALDYAHRQGVIHRDIKPENIMLHEGQPIVADFGIARAVMAGVSDNVTARGIALGTVAYMSPEQSAGDEVGPATDQYALACVLYEILTGRPPFVGANVRAVIAQHLAATATPIRTIRATVPPAVDAAVLRALAKEPAERFPTMADLREALESTRVAMARPADETTALAVLPFVNATADPAGGYLADGITEELVRVLSRIPAHTVTSTAAVAASRGRHDDPREVGRELGVSVVLEGTVRHAGDRIRIGAQLTSVDDGRVVWSERFDRQVGDLFDLQDDLSRRIVAALRTSLADEPPPAPRRYTTNLKAYHLYLRGRFAWNLRTAAGMAEAARLFEEAIGEDPNHALAYAGLSDAHALNMDYASMPVREMVERARREAERALALDEELAEAHTSLGWIHFIHDWDWEQADRELRRAIELNPSYATAHQWYAWLLLALGRVDEAIGEGQLARDLDPASLSPRRSLGWLYCYARLPAQALPHLHAALAMNPALEETNYILGLAYLQAGDLGAAEVALRTAQDASPGHFRARAALGRLAALRGDRTPAERTLADMHAAAAHRYVSPVDFIALHLALAETDQVFAGLERAYQDRRGWMAYLRVEPMLDPVRSDPRFGELLRRMNLD